MESGRLFNEDDPSSGSRVVVFAEVRWQEIAFWRQWRWWGHLKMLTCRDDPSSSWRAVTWKVERTVGNVNCPELYNRPIYERCLSSEPFIKKYKVKHAILHELSHILFSCMYINTIVYLEAIENPVESRNYFELSEKQDQKTEGICFWGYSCKHSKVLLATLVCEG